MHIQTSVPRQIRYYRARRRRELIARFVILTAAFVGAFLALTVRPGF